MIENSHDPKPEELQRREFIRRTAIATTLVASFDAVAKEPAKEMKVEEILKILSEHKENLTDEEAWQGLLDRSLAVYGNLTHVNLFERPLTGALYSDLETNINNNTGAGKPLDAVQAAALKQALSMLNTNFGTKTFAEHFTGKVSYSTADPNLLALLAAIHKNIIWIYFVDLPPLLHGATEKALHEGQDSLTHANGSGGKTVWKVWYEKRSDVSNNHLGAITKGKKGWIFGPTSHNSYAEVSALSGGGINKGNNRICTDPACTTGDCCEDCANSGFFCTTATGGGCSAVSDDGPCVQ